MENNYYGGKKKRSVPVSEKVGHGWHSPSYHKFFEDYAEYEVTGANGRTKIIREYVGEWYELDIDAGKRKPEMIRLIAIWLLSAAIFAFCTTRWTAANATWYAAIVEFASIVTLIWCLISLIGFVTLPAKMTVSEYKRTSVKFSRSSLSSAIALGLCALATLIGLIAEGSEPLWTLISAGGFIIAGGLMFIAWRMHKRIPVKTSKNDVEASRDAVVID